jgi:hypothetical protein
VEATYDNKRDRSKASAEGEVAAVPKQFAEVAAQE